MAKKKRIFEVAKELGVPSMEILDLLAKHNIKKFNVSGIDDNDMAIINSRYHGGAAKPEPAAKPAAPKPAPAKKPAQEAKPAPATPILN